ncbi:MAG: transcriptional repressor LexA [gamma proteobacterium symbiont of Bathyaustriella thionipta]|nr:transcriptional repressor LexA [gamma proteobacterium symbiont of Bathyaustriella thionipta]
MQLTRRQQQVYDFLLQQHHETDHAPTLDEICAHLGVSSRGSMHKHIQALIDAGLVEAPRHKHRGIRLKTQSGGHDDRLPLMGYIAAGQPLEAVSEPESVQVPRHLHTGKDCYVLQVRGDSMMDDGILDEDWVIIEPCNSSRNHEIVAALVDHSEVTLKRIEQKPGEVLLHPANSRMQAMSFEPERIQIQGRLVGQMRRYF